METLIFILFLSGAGQIVFGERSYSMATIFPVFVFIYFACLAFWVGEFGQVLGLLVGGAKTVTTAVRFAYLIAIGEEIGSPFYLWAFCFETIFCVIFILIILKNVL